jgi:ATP-dependent Lhr-like helicase
MRRRGSRGPQPQSRVCEGAQVELDKSGQAGDWKRRPLTESQVAYAALDAEALLQLSGFQVLASCEQRVTR